MQEVLTLLLVYVLTGLGTDVLFQFEKLQLLVESLQCKQHTLLDGICGKHRELVRNGERQIRADEVYGYDVILYVVERELRLIWYFLVLLYVINCRTAQIVERRLELAVTFFRHFLVCGDGFSLQERACVCELGESAPSQSLYDNCHVVVVAWHFKHSDQFGIYTIFVKVALLRMVVVCVLLTEYGECGVLCFFQMVYKVDTNLASDKNR